MKTQCLFSCGCQQWIVHPPAWDDDWLCWQHGAVRRVRRVEWHIRCKQCRYGRHGLGQVTAHTLATKHHMAKRHQIRVWCVSSGKTTTDWSTDDNQLSFDDIPPF